MTTIAWDGKTLASDSQSQVGNMIVSKNEQKIFPATSEWSINGYPVKAIAIAGDSAATYEIINHLQKGLLFDSEFSQITDFNLIAVIRADFAFVVSKNKDDTRAYICDVFEEFAIGSGDAYAMAAMKSGKTAKEAVEVAISLDVYSGGIVQGFQC
ncbi:TPA: hypothetical protein ACS7Z1_000059 [Providencia alcalifaciens]